MESLQKTRQEFCHNTRGTPALPQILVTNLSPEMERGVNEEAMLDPVKVRVAGKLATKEMESVLSPAAFNYLIRLF